jgi:DnaJ domain
MTTTLDYYEILQVSPKADDDIIGMAYRRLSQKWHPEKNPGDRFAAEQMMLLNEAFEVLSDTQNRREYDLLRKRPVKSGAVHEEVPQVTTKAREYPATPAPRTASTESSAPEAEVSPSKPESWHWHVTLVAFALVAGILREFAGLGGFVAVLIASVVGKGIAMLLVPEPSLSNHEAPHDSVTTEKEICPSAASDPRPPKPRSAEARTTESPAAASPERQEAVSPAAWVIFAIGAFLFVMAHGSTLFAQPGLFLGTCLIWGLLFGIPAYLCFVIAKRNGMIAVATLFLLAAGLDVAIPIYVRQELKTMSIEALVQFPSQAERERAIDEERNPYKYLAERLEHIEQYMARDIVRDSATQGHQWEDVSAHLKRLNVDPSQFKQRYDAAIQQKKLNEARAKEQTKGESQVAIPVISAIGNLKQIEMYRQAHERFNARKATQEDIDIIVRCERLQESGR